MKLHRYTSGILICVPAYGQTVAAQTMEAIYTTCQFLTAQGIKNQLTWMSAADIVEVRNLMLTTWYDHYSSYSHLLFIDSDMGFKPELIRDMLEFNKPLIGTLYARRQATPSTVGVPIGSTSKDIVQGHMLCTGVGMGVTLIHRNVVTEMLKRLPDVNDTVPGVIGKSVPHKLTRFLRAFDPIKEPNLRLSEDFSFCHRWRQCGGEVWANVNHRISHVGPFDFAIRYAGVIESMQEADRKDDDLHADGAGHADAA